MTTPDAAVPPSVDDAGAEGEAGGTGEASLLDVPVGLGESVSLEEAGRALFRLGRFFGSRSPRRLLGEDGPAVARSRAVVVEVVAAGPPDPGGEVTVGLVAARLGLDPSTASRLVAETIRDGYLRRGASPADGRRVSLELSDEGRRLAVDARRYQGAVFARLTADWSPEERDAFARLFVRFAAAVAEAVDAPPSADDPASPFR